MSSSSSPKKKRSNRRMSHIPSDIPSLRLVQLMRRALEQANNGQGFVTYTSIELTELKELLLLVCHQTLYKTDNIVDATASSPSQRLSGKTNVRQTKDFQDTQNAWIKEQHQSHSSPRKGRLSAGDAALRRLSISSSADPKKLRDTRVLSCPEPNIVSGVSFKIQSGKFKIDTYLIEKLEEVRRFRVVVVNQQKDKCIYSSH